MRWISIDPGTTSGVAAWCDGVLVSTGVVKPIGKGGRWRIPGGEARSEVAAWSCVLEDVDAVVCEACGFGLPRQALASLSRRIGGLHRQVELVGARWSEANVTEWRRVAREAWSVSFPADSAACKALARSLVREHYGRDVSEDEADAVLIGAWALRTRAVEVTL